jgi:hypothetical protein
MPRLPFNPWLYIAIVVVLGIALQFSPPSSIELWIMVVSSLALALQLTWLGQAMRLTVAVYEPAAKYVWRMKASAICAIIGIGIALSTDFTARVSVGSSQFIVGFFAGFAGTLAFFWTSWPVAAALCNAEDGGETRAIRIIGTFLLCLYLIIGAPFIYKRLKTLLLASPKQRLASSPAPA